MFSSFYHNAKIDKKWSLLTIAIVLLLGAPLLTILLKLFSGPGESWAHIKEYLLLDYLSNSLFLMVACSIFTLILGVIPAWLVSAYSFPFRKLLQWLLILPLAFPNYLTAYAYAGLFDYSGIYERMMVQIFNVDHVSHIDIMGIWGLAWVMSFSLYPYVYLSARSFFSHQSHRQMSAAKVLGAGRFKAFYSIALPLARPAVVGGLLLVMMEVLGDYGSAYYYGVSTYTTAIFRSWFALEEPETAVYLSAQLCMFILFLIVMERSLRGKKKYQFNSEGSQELIKKTPKAHIQVMFMLVIIIPISLGFILPLIQMMYWASLTFHEVWSTSLLSIVWSSFYLSMITAFICICISFLLIYAAKWSRSLIIQRLSSLPILGYAVPGVVIAVGIMIPTLIFDKWLVNIAQYYLNWSMGFLINGTIIGLIFAYSVRFLAVAYHPIEASIQKTGMRFEQAAQMLGVQRWKRMLQINIPLNKLGLLSGALLVFVDTMKELPLTLLLKPYGIMTLSVKAFEYASDERIAETALPALFIIMTGLIPIFLLNRMMNT